MAHDNLPKMREAHPHLRIRGKQIPCGPFCSAVSNQHGICSQATGRYGTRQVRHGRAHVDLSFRGHSCGSVSAVALQELSVFSDFNSGQFPDTVNAGRDPDCLPARISESEPFCTVLRIEISYSMDGSEGAVVRQNEPSICLLSLERPGRRGLLTIAGQSSGNSQPARP